jgi:hypothetical protein
MRGAGFALMAAWALGPLTAAAQQAQVADRVGDSYELRMSDVSETSGDRSSGSSSSRTTLIERVVGLRDGGVELEFDTPSETSADDRARNWQYPARVFKRPGHQLELLNEAELESRVSVWLKKRNIPRAACGKWTFTWTAIKIECDPRSVLEQLKGYDLRQDNLRDGEFYREEGVKALVPLRARASSANAVTLVAEMEVDPDAVRRANAESDVVVAQIMGDTKTVEQALEARRAEQISGTMTSTFELDGAGRVTRSVRVSRVETVGKSGERERVVRTLTIERKLLQ